MKAKIIRSLACALVIGFAGCKTSSTDLTQFKRGKIDGSVTARDVFQSMVAAGQYVPLQCHQNVINLTNNLERKVPSFNIKDAIVLFFHPRESTSVSMQVFAAPQGRFRWFYHVVLLYDDEIFDLSYGKIPKVAGLETYLKEMFWGIKDQLPEPENLEKITVKRIPADKWRSEFDKVVDGERHDLAFYRRTKKYSPRILDNFLVESEGP